MRNIFYAFITLISICLFSFLIVKIEDYEKIADVITAKIAKELRVEKGLRLIGTGGRMMDDIKMMNMGFEFFSPLDITKSRELLLSIIKKYLIAINNNEKIRPYLHEYPFTAKNIEIDIWIRNPDGSSVSLDMIYYISAINGILYYYIDDPEKYSRKTVHQETYEEALKIITSANVKVPAYIDSPQVGARVAETK